MRSAKQGITWKMILSAAGDSGNEKDHSPYNLRQKPWNTWKISFPFVSPFPFAMLLWPTSPHCRGKGKSTGVSRIFGEDCRHCVVPCQNADVMHNLSTSYGAWNLSSYLPRRKEAGFPLFESIVAMWSGAIPIFLIIHAAFFWLDAAFIYR